MKALYKSGPHAGFEYTDRPVPEPGAHDVLIRVHMAGICGTDLHIEAYDQAAQDMIAPPMIPGHEFYGEVVKTGDYVKDVKVGDRVSGEGHVVCGMCRNCRAGRRQMCIRTQSVGVQRDGAFAEYVVIPESNVWVHTDDFVTPELGAIFDPLGNATHTALLNNLVGEDVLITGAGPIGLMSAAIARHAGARKIVVTDLNEERLKLVEGMGADAGVLAGKEKISDVQRRLGMNEGFDVGLEISGAQPALSEMIENMNHGGRIALLGLPNGAWSIDGGRIVTRMLTLQGVYGREMYETWYAMTAMLQTDELFRERITSVISDVVPASEWREAFDIARSGQRGKVLLDWRNV